MRSLFVIGLLTAAATFPQAALAETRGGFEVGALALDYSYRERLDGTTIARDHGTMGGFMLGYTETLGNGVFARARFHAAVGEVDYRQDDGEGFDDVEQGFGGLELHLGRDFKAANATITPYAGFGARLFDDQSGGKVTAGGLEGYNREARYRYIPTGVSAQVPVGGRKFLHLTAQRNWLVSGSVVSLFNETDAELPAVEVKLDSGHGTVVSALLELPVGRRAVRFGPFVETWSIKRSESRFFEDDGDRIEFFEPPSRTTKYGFQLSFAF